MLTPLLVAAALAAPVPKASADLAWKFNPGDTFYLTHETTTGFPREDGQPAYSRTIRVVYKVTVPKTRNGDTCVELEVVSARSSDGKTGEKPTHMMYKEIVGLKVRITMVGGKVTEVEWAEGFAKAGGGGMDGHFSREAFREAADGWFGSVPGMRLTVGDGWEAEAEYTPENFRVKWVTKGKLTAVTNGVADLTATAVVSVKGKADAGRGLTLTTTGESEACDIAVQFDTTRGRLVKRVETLSTRGTVATTGGGQPDSSSPFTVQQTTTTTITDEEPKEDQGKK